MNFEQNCNLIITEEEAQNLISEKKKLTTKFLDFLKTIKKY